MQIVQLTPDVLRRVRYRLNSGLGIVAVVEMTSAEAEGSLEDLGPIVRRVLGTLPDPEAVALVVIRLVP
jgi:hypothetical protein